MAAFHSPRLCYFLFAVAIGNAAASDSSEGASLRGALASNLAGPRRTQEVQAPNPIDGGGLTIPQNPVWSWGNGDHSRTDWSTGTPLDLLMHGMNGKAYFTRFVVLMIAGFLYWCCIASRYPKLWAPSPTSARLQSENELNATCQASFANCLYSYICSQARAAHTFDATGTCNYWPSLVLMTLCPCPTLFWMNSCTDLNEKLGGRRKDCCSGLIRTFCCSCCVIAQDAESLDMATGARTQCCGVEHAPHLQGMHPGVGMPHQHQMHHMHQVHHMPVHHQQGGFMVQPQASYGYGQGYPMQAYPPQF